MPDPPPPPTQILARRYGVDEAELEPLGSFESAVYAFAGPHGPSVLKVVAPEHRSAAQIRAELDWLRALRADGVPVAQPLASEAGQWIEQQGGYCAVAFARSPGRITTPQDWDDALIRTWGALLGRLQRHARTYRPPGPWRRTLREQSFLPRAAEVLPNAPRFVAEAARLWTRGQHLLADQGDAGLVHADLHAGNLLLGPDGWTAIDFDDSGYGAFAFDLAMPLYYAVRTQRDRSPEAVACAYLPPFLDGFLAWAPLPTGDPRRLARDMATALSLRSAELAVKLRAKVPEAEWTDSMRAASVDLVDIVAQRRAVVPVEVLEEILSAHA